MRLEGSSHRDTPDVNVIDWLLEEDQPSVRYHTLVDLLGRNEDDPEVKAAYSTIPRVGWAHDLLRTQKPKGYWEAHEPRTVREWVNFLRFPLYNSSIWKGIVLSDLGLTATDPRVRRLADRIFQYKLHLSSEVNLFTEEICIVGNAARMLTRFGYTDDRRVRKLYDWMIEDQRRPDGGWLLDVVQPDMVPGAGSVPYLKKHKRFTLEAPGKPSKWITLTALRVLRRVEDAS